MLFRFIVRRTLIVLLLFGSLVGSQFAPSAARAQETVAAAAAPTLAYSSFLGGGSDDEANDVAVSATGEIYVLGKTFSEDLLGRQVTISGYSDLYVAKFNAAGTQLLYLAIVGGTGTEEPHAIGVDAQGNAYVTAAVYSDAPFPTKNALWSTKPDYQDSGVLFKLNPQGNLVYSTYLPLDVFNASHNLAVDAAGNAFVTGTAYGIIVDDVYMGAQIGLLKISPNGQTVLLDKNYGSDDQEEGRAIAIDKAGAIYLAGTSKSTGDPDFPVTSNAHQPQCGDIFYQGATYCYQDSVVLALNASGGVTYASYHGGSFTDEPTAVAADGKGTVVVVGKTSSPRFPLVNALPNKCQVDTSLDICYSPYGFVSAIKIQSPKATLTYSTYLGSTERSSWTQPLAAALDGAGNIHVAGYTNGAHVPIKNAPQPEINTGLCIGAASVRAEDVNAPADRFCFDGFVTELTPSGALAFGTYLGGGHDEFFYGITTDASGSIYVAGTSRATDFPTTANAFQPNPPLPRNGVLARFGGAIPDASVIIGVDPAAPGGHVDVAVVSQPGAAEAESVAAPDATYPVGTVLRLTAVPDTGYTFTGWGGDVNATANPMQVTVSGPLTVRATFAKVTYSTYVYLPAVKTR